MRWTNLKIQVSKKNHLATKVNITSSKDNDDKQLMRSKIKNIIKGVARKFLEGGSKSSKMSATGWLTKKILGYGKAKKNVKFESLFNEISNNLTCPF